VEIKKIDSFPIVSHYWLLLTNGSFNNILEQTIHKRVFFYLKDCQHGSKDRSNGGTGC